MRTIMNYNAGWAFSKDATEVPAALPADWEVLNLPHSWNAVDGQDGGSDYYRGTAYYVKNLSKADLPSSDLYYLEFQGTNSSAVVVGNVIAVYINIGRRICALKFKIVKVA